MLSLLEDMHIHSTFSDGKNTPAENLAVAEGRGLKRICMVDHVRESSDWMPAFYAEVDRLREQTDLEVLVGVETKILDEDGRLDLPDAIPDATRVYIADHRFPLESGCLGPREIRRRLEDGELGAARAYEALVNGTRRAIERTHRPILAHLFSILPRVGLSEEGVPNPLLQSLAQTAAAVGAEIEIDERWRCPNAATVQVFLDAGVTVVSSTDSHRACDIGAYDFVKQVHAELR